MIYLIISPFFPTPGHFWGSFVYDQVVAITRTRKYDRVIVMRSCGIFEKQTEYIYDGIKVATFPYYSTPSRILDGIQDDFNVRLFKRTIKSIGINLSDVGIAHFHTSSLACLAVWIKKEYPQIKTLLQHHDLDPLGINVGKFGMCKWNLYYKIRKRYKWYPLIDCHVCVSEACRDNLLCFPGTREHEKYTPYLNKLVRIKNNFQRITIKNTIVLYNGVDTQKFCKIDNKRTDNIFRIGCVGRFIDLKNQMLLIKAVELLQKNHSMDNIELQFIGDGPMLETCKRYVEEKRLDSNIIFEKSRMPDKLYEFYNTLNLFVLPSEFEGFGCVFTEAYACGVPFMTCRYQGVEHLISEEDKSKWMCTNKDYKELAKMIYNYYTHRNQQILVKSYDINVLIADFLEKVEYL